MQQSDTEDELSVAASVSPVADQGRVVQINYGAIDGAGVGGPQSRVELRAWWLARQSGWVLVAGLLAASVANGLIVALLVVIDRLIATSEFGMLPLETGWSASIAAFWQRAHPRGWFGPLEMAVAVGAVATLLTLIVCGAISLTRVHRHESIAASFHRCMAGLIAITPAIALQLLACGLAIVAGRAALYWNELRYSDFLEGAIRIVPITVGVLRVTRKMADVTDGMAGPPPLIPDKRCQDCGYDLSGHIDLPRCGECGSPTASSLTPGLRRYPNVWEQKRTAESWLAATIRLLSSPSKFYATLGMRDSLAVARAFGRIHFVAIGIVAMCWLLVCAAVELSTGSSRRDLDKLHLPALVAAIGSIVAIVVIRNTSLPIRMIAVGPYATAVLFLLVSRALTPGEDDAPQITALGCFSIAFAAPLVCWLGQRINGTVAALPLLGRDGLPDGRWAETVIAYESAFCWFFCIGWGLLVWSYFAWDDWISRWIGTSITNRIIGMPPEPAALIAVALIGGLIWQVRFRIALRAVRWANE